MYRLALETWSLQYGVGGWLLQDHLSLARVVAVYVECFLVYDCLTLRGFVIVVVDGVDGFLSSHGSHLVTRLMGLDAHIVFFDASFCLLLDVFFVPFDKFLPDLFTIGQMPILFEFFDAFLFHNAFEDILTCRLIIEESLLLNQLLNSISRSLVDSVTVP